MYRTDANAMYNSDENTAYDNGMGAFIDRTGMKFNRLTIVGYDRSLPRLRAVTKCDCGTVAIKQVGSVVYGDIQSCGCMIGDHNRARWTAHGHASDGKYSKEYISWMGMKARCFNARARNYRWYGARGITVCSRWLESFESFFSSQLVAAAP